MEKISSSIPWPLTNGITLCFPWKNKTKIQTNGCVRECIRSVRHYQETLQHLVDCISIGFEFDLIVRFSCGDMAHYDLKMHSFRKTKRRKKFFHQQTLHANHGQNRLYTSLDRVFVCAKTSTSVQFTWEFKQIPLMICFSLFCLQTLVLCGVFPLNTRADHSFCMFQSGAHTQQTSRGCNKTHKRASNVLCAAKCFAFKMQ